jgi:hypothetical protein
MAINPPNFGVINQQAGQIVLEARGSLQKIIFFNQYLQSLGKANLVILGFTSDDADLLLGVYGNLAAVANTCMGAPYAGPPLPFNFLAQTVPLWGGS